MGSQHCLNAIMAGYLCIAFNKYAKKPDCVTAVRFSFRKDGSPVRSVLVEDIERGAAIGDEAVDHGSVSRRADCNMVVGLRTGEFLFPHG